MYDNNLYIYLSTNAHSMCHNISLILRRWWGLQTVWIIEVLMVRKPKFRSSKGVLPSMAGKLCFTDSGTAQLSMSQDPGFCSTD